MPNLSHLVIIDEVLEKNHLIQDIISEYGEDIPEPLLKAIADLDFKMRQFGDYWIVRERLINEGVII